MCQYSLLEYDHFQLEHSITNNMNKITQSLLLISMVLINHLVSAQEWKNMKDYQKSTGESELQEGCWLKKDRLKNTETWNQANKFNLSLDNGNLKYVTIEQKRDFYYWFDDERKRRGHEINVIGVAALVANQLTNFENAFIAKIVVRNKDVVWFAHEGSNKVLEYAFPQLKKVYFSDKILIQEEANEWDLEYGKAEQCDIVEKVYNQLPEKAIQKLERIAKGKGIYRLAVKNKLQFEGKITDCKARYEHAFNKLMPYYLDEDN